MRAEGGRAALNSKLLHDCPLAASPTWGRGDPLTWGVETDVAWVQRIRDSECSEVQCVALRFAYLTVCRAKAFAAKKSSTSERGAVENRHLWQGRPVMSKRDLAVSRVATESPTFVVNAPKEDIVGQE